jgi:hypothetical protein
MANASTGYFAISRESVRGTAITTPTKFYPVEEADFDAPIEMTDIKEIALSRDAYTSFDGPLRPTATIRGAVYPSGAMGLLMLGLMGSRTDAAENASVTAKRHTFVTGTAALPTFTLEVTDKPSGAGGILCQRMAGAMVENVSFSAAYGEKLDMTVTFQTMKGRTKATPVASGAVTYPVSKALIFTNAKVEIDDVDSPIFKSINFEFRNTLMREEVLNGSLEAEDISEGGQECTISATVRFKDQVFLDRYLDRDEFKLEVIFIGDTVADAATTPDVFYGAHFTWPIVRLSNFKTTYTAGEIIEGEAEFKVIYDKVAKLASKIELINLDAGTVYNT